MDVQERTDHVDLKVDLDLVESKGTWDRLE